MTTEKASHRIDDLLLPFLNAKDEQESQHHLEQLLTGSAEPVLKMIAKRKLLPSSNRPGIETPLGIEDVCGEALLQLLVKLRELKSNPHEKPIENFRGYVAVVGYNACHEHIRQKHPRRYRLRNRVRYLLTHDPRFALWQSGGESICGFATWIDSEGQQRGARRLHELRDSTTAFEESDLSSRDLELLDLDEFLRVVFESVGYPVELDELVNAIAEWKGVKEENVEATSDAAETAKVRGADSRVPVDVEVEQRIYLQRLWSEICQLPPRQRAALLLNLKDGQGRDCVTLFPLSGIATPRDIAVLLDLPVEQFAEMWNKLPLDDLSIAVHLGITRQQVINLRKSARERLARRMKAF